MSVEGLELNENTTLIQIREFLKNNTYTTDIVNFLIKYKYFEAIKSYKDVNDYTTLMYLCIYSKALKSEDTIKYLLDVVGVDVNMKNSYNDCALTLSCLYSNDVSSEEVINILLKHPDIDVNIKNGDEDTALMLSCSYSNDSSNDNTVRMLLEHPDINVNLQNKEKDTALILSCTIGDNTTSDNTVKMLLEHPDINVNVQNSDGDTALIISCVSYDNTTSVNNVKMLLEHNDIDVNLQNIHGNTALIESCGILNENVILLLLTYEFIDIRIKNKNGDTAYKILTNTNYKGVLLNLFYSNEDLNIDVSTVINFMDPITLDIIEGITIQEYINENIKDNIIIKYKLNNNNIRFIPTKKSYIYKSSYIKGKNILLNMRLIGLYIGDVCDITDLYKYNRNNLFVLQIPENTMGQYPQLLLGSSM